jgi:hypothetical protein
VVVLGHHVIVSDDHTRPAQDLRPRHPRATDSRNDRTIRGGPSELAAEGSAQHLILHWRADALLLRCRTLAIHPENRTDVASATIPNVRVFDGEHTLENQTVTIEGTGIASVRPSSADDAARTATRGFGPEPPPPLPSSSVRTRHGGCTAT